MKQNYYALIGILCGTGTVSVLFYGKDFIQLVSDL